MRLNSSAPGPWVGLTGDPFTQPPSVLEGALLAPGLGNGSGNLSEPVPAAPSSDLDVNTDIYSKVLVTIVYLALFVVGTVGNSVTAFTLARKKSLQNLQSTVHYHLGSLALSDLLILLLAMPVELYNFIWVHHPWAFGDAVCRGYYFLRDACTYATALNVASLSVERYLAICHPFKAKTLMSRSRTKKFISAVWLASGLLAVPMLFTMGQQNRSADGQHPGGLVCTPIVGTATVKAVIQPGRGILTPGRSLLRQGPGPGAGCPPEQVRAEIPPGMACTAERLLSTCWLRDLRERTLRPLKSDVICGGRGRRDLSPQSGRKLVPIKSGHGSFSPCFCPVPPAALCPLLPPPSIHLFVPLSSITLPFLHQQPAHLGDADTCG
ncbi:hypothetical protein FD754_012503 [Muntiacus muntjak]|uniref:G-protein coupled receptors family 1 profile domain-containing protein n=1 Tax=Muntiacus muntjak TaxID=9888 RepID=A0A5N3VHR6_MUNMU|nr:hypothetical protein FD754_012503 [Muntiacus muntjak]